MSLPKKVFFLVGLSLLICALGCSLLPGDEDTQSQPLLATDAGSLTAGSRTAGDPYALINVGTDYPVTLKHLQYRDGIWSWSTWKANTGFPGYAYFLNGQNPNDWDQRDTQHIFVAEIWTPPVDQIENIVFLSAGQQGAIIDRQDYPAIVTGQQENWHANSGINGWVYLKSKNLNISWKSVAGQIMADNQFNNSEYFGFKSSNTYMVLVFDACFYYELGSGDKTRLLGNYLDWLLSKAGENTSRKLETIYLAGASRGGALVSRMAYELKHNSKWSGKVNNARIIVSLFDAVANESQGELNTYSNIGVNNPDGEGWVYYSTFTSSLTNTNNLHILQTAGGRQVTFLSSARAFYLHDLPGVVEFRWVSRSHTEIGRNWYTDTSVAQLQWLNQWTAPSLTNVTVNNQHTNPVRVSLSGSIYLKGQSTHTHKYYISVTPCDQWWNVTGREVYEWITSPNGFEVINFDLKALCARQGLTLQRGRYYRVKLATGDTWLSDVVCIYTC